MEKDLRTYLERMKREGKFLSIDHEVDPRTEAPALIKRSVEKGKALLLMKIKGSSMVVLGNTMGSRGWIAETFGCSKQELISLFGDRASQPLPTLKVKRAPVKEVIEETVDLSAFPILTLHEEDAGPYITGGVAIQKDPETGRRNAGYYSLQLKGKDRLGLRMLPSTHGFEIFQKRLALGKRTEMAVAIGLHPFEMLAASTHTVFDELELAGGLRGESLDVVTCETIDLEVPAHAEIILEGVILPDSKEPEGPIGDWLGYYPLVEERHILKINKITHRTDPIYQTILSGSSEENLLLAIPREADVFKAAKKMVSGVKNVSLDPFLPICVIQLHKRFEGEPMNAILAAMGEVSFIKICIAVDEDVDLYDLKDILWAVATRTQLEEDLNVIRHVMGFSRDPYHLYKSKLAIDATSPLEQREHFRRTRIINDGIDFERYLSPRS